MWLNNVFFLNTMFLILKALIEKVEVWQLPDIIWWDTPEMFKRRTPASQFHWCPYQKQPHYMTAFPLTAFVQRWVYYTDQKASENKLRLPTIIIIRTIHTTLAQCSFLPLWITCFFSIQLLSWNYKVNYKVFVKSRQFQSSFCSL